MFLSSTITRGEGNHQPRSHYNNNARLSNFRIATATSGVCTVRHLPDFFGRPDLKRGSEPKVRERESESSRLSKFLFSLAVAAAGASDASAPAPPSSDKDLGIGGRGARQHRVSELFQLSTGLAMKLDDSKEFPQKIASRA